MAESMEDTDENRQKYIRFIAQEVKNDGKIPHFDQSAIDEIIREASRAYEANLNMIDAARQMTSRALDLLRR